MEGPGLLLRVRQTNPDSARVGGDDGALFKIIRMF